MGYLHLCCELLCRTEAFSTICQLDDISLLEEPDGKKTTNLITSMSKITELGSKSYLKSSSCARTGTGKMRRKKSQMLFFIPLQVLSPRP